MVLLAGLIWGLTFSLAKIAVDEGAHPLGLTFWQACLGSLVLIVIALIRRDKPTWEHRTWLHVTVIALMGTALPGALYFYAASKVPAGILSITTALVPLATYLISLMLRIESFMLRRVFGIVTGLAAILLLVGPEASLPSRDMVPWVLLVLVAVFFYAVENVYVGLCVPNSANMTFLLMMALLLAAIIMLPIVLLNNAFVAMTFPPDKVTGVMLLMGVVSSIAYLIFLNVVRMAGPVFASLIGYTVTVAGVMWGLLIFGERHSPWVWLSLLVMLTGLMLVTPAKSNAALVDRLAQ